MIKLRSSQGSLDKNEHGNVTHVVEGNEKTSQILSWDTRNLLARKNRVKAAAVVLGMRVLMRLVKLHEAQPQHLPSPGIQG